MAAETSEPLPKLSSDELDDLIYFARAGDIQELHGNIRSLSEKYNASFDAVINSAVDLDPEDPQSSSGCSLLHWAAANDHQDILNFLLTRIATDKPEAISTTNGITAESQPIKPRKGGLVNHQNTSGNTPLHWAALNGNLECVKFLVRAGADPAIRNSAGHDAVYEGERGELNKNGPPPQVPEGEPGTSQDEQTQPKKVGVVEWLLENCDGLDKGLGDEDQVGEASGAVRDMTIDD